MSEKQIRIAIDAEMNCYNYILILQTRNNIYRHMAYRRLLEAGYLALHGNGLSNIGPSDQTSISEPSRSIPVKTSPLENDRSAAYLKNEVIHATESSDTSVQPVGIISENPFTSSDSIRLMANFLKS